MSHMNESCHIWVSHVTYVNRGGTKAAQIRMLTLATPFGLVPHWRFVRDMTHMWRDMTHVWRDMTHMWRDMTHMWRDMTHMWRDSRHMCHVPWTMTHSCIYAMTQSGWQVKRLLYVTSYSTYHTLHSLYYYTHFTTTTDSRRGALSWSSCHP